MKVSGLLLVAACIASSLGVSAFGWSHSPLLTPCFLPRATMIAVKQQQRMRASISPSQPEGPPVVDIAQLVEGRAVKPSMPAVQQISCAAREWGFFQVRN
eukprot:91031-Hanusia_phi.AAC.1